MSKQLIIKTGNQMIAEGALKAGCMFFAGYPITPASGIYKTMTEELPKIAGCSVSAPDEISAIAYAIGASMRGVKAMTATSGPGWALMIESVQYSLITETPIVIALVQRLGPATGGATQNAQGDIYFSQFMTSGGYTIPTLCPTNAREAYALTIKAFSIAEKLRTPVILLSDKETAMTSETIDINALVVPEISQRTLKEEVASLEQVEEMYSIENSYDVPKFAEVGGVYKVTATGSAHNMSGELKKNDPETMYLLRHLEDKITFNKELMKEYFLDEQENAEHLIIAYGITARTAKEAVRTLRAQNFAVSLLVIHSLFPIPEDGIVTATSKVSHVIIPEENMQGQYRRLINHLFFEKKITPINVIGRLITPSEIVDAVGGHNE